MLAPFKTTFHAPAQTGLYLFTDDSYVVENFSDGEAAVELDGASLKVPARGWITRWK
jgi:chaperone required for assembly of F1-ATPase